ncbi:MAG: phosphotransferase [Calothrix sp. MO_192.B10]|nr:phosphotransferase [Calothrix sp. MO_192.B10]
MNKLNNKTLINYLENLENQGLLNLKSAKLCVKNSQAFYLVFNLKNNIILTAKQQFIYHQVYANYLSFLKESNLYFFIKNCDSLIDIWDFLPTIINFNINHLILIYKYPATYTTLQSFYENSNDFSKFIAQKVGKIIAKLHRKTNQSQECFNFMNEVQPNFHIPYPAYLLDRFEIDSFYKLSAQTLSFIAFYQRYDSLKSAVQELIINHRRFSLTHNNLKLNKILISKNILSKTNEENQTAIKLIDWENCSWGDPAFDVGTILAGYLQIWLNSLTINPAINLEESLKFATIPLENLQPSLIFFIQAYLKEYPNILQNYPDFIQRVIQFSGLAIIYEIITKIESCHVFEGTDICMLQVAKNLLCKPSQSFRAILGITEADIINY